MKEEEAIQRFFEISPENEFIIKGNGVSVEQGSNRFHWKRALAGSFLVVACMFGGMLGASATVDAIRGVAPGSFLFANISDLEPHSYFYRMAVLIGMAIGSLGGLTTANKIGSLIDESRTRKLLLS